MAYIELKDVTRVYPGGNGGIHALETAWVDAGAEEEAAVLPQADRVRRRHSPKDMDFVWCKRIPSFKIDVVTGTSQQKVSQKLLARLCRGTRFVPRHGEIVSNSAYAAGFFSAV